GNARRVQVILVELQDRTAHRRVLDRQVRAEGIRREDEAAGVRRAQTRHVVEGLQCRQQSTTAWIVQLEAVLLRHTALQLLRELRRLPVVRTLRQREDEIGGVAERAHHVLQRRRPVVQLRDRRDRGVRATVAVVHVVEYLLAAVHLEVDVDVRRLRLAVRAHLREETLEEQAVTHGIDRRDAEAVRNRTVRRAAAPLAENAARAREADRVPHHEEEPRKAEIADDAQLVLDLRALPLVRLAP